MITFTQKEVEDLIDTLLADEDRTEDRFLAIGLDYARRLLALRLEARVIFQLAQLEGERSQGPFGEELTTETTLYPAPPHSTEPEVD